MATIASLAVQLIADPTKFVTGMSVASKAVQRTSGLVRAGVGNINGLAGSLAGSLAHGDVTAALHTGVNKVSGAIQNLLGKIPYIGPAMAGSVSIATDAFEGLLTWAERLLGIFKEGAARVNEMRVASSKLGVDVAAMGGLGLLAGGDFDKVARGMLHFQKSLAEASAKAEGTEVIFSRLGLSAKDLAQMPADQALRVFAGAFGKLQLSSQKALTASEVFGAKVGAELLPILARGVAGFDQAEAAAKRFALSVSATDAEGVRQASLALKQTDLALAGIKTQAAVGLAPVILELADNFEKVSINAQTVQQWAVKIAKWIAYGGAAGVEAWRGLEVVWTMLKNGFRAMIADQMAKLQLLLDVAGKLPDSLGGGLFRELGADIGREISATWAGINADIQEGKANVARFGDSFKVVDDFFARVQVRAERMKETMKGVGKEPPMNPRFFELFEKGQKLAQEFRSPLEKMQERIAELNEMLDAGVIQWETYARAIGGAAAELMKAGQQEFKMAPTAEFGSQEAFSAIGKAQFGIQSQSGVDSLREGMKQQIEIQKQQKQRLDDIAQAVRGGLFQQA